MWSLSLLLLCVSAGSAFVNSGFLPNFGSQQSYGSWSNSGLWHKHGTAKIPSSFDTWDFTVNGQRYRLAGLQNGKTWSSARLHCKSLSMDLVVIDSEYLNKRITQTLNGLGMSVKMGAWIGLTDIQREGQFKNLCNGAPTYTAWDRNQPDNNYGSADCVVIKNVFGVGKWSDEVCTTWRPFVCGPRTSSNCKTPTTTLSTSTIGSKCEDSMWPCTFLHCLSETGRGYCAKTCSSCGAAHTTSTSFYSSSPVRPTFPTLKLTSRNPTFTTSTKPTKTTVHFSTTKSTFTTTSKLTFTSSTTPLTTLNVISKQSTTKNIATSTTAKTTVSKQSTKPVSPSTLSTLAPTSTYATASISPTTTTSAPTSISPTTTTSATTSISPTTTTSATTSSTMAPTTAAPTTPTSTSGCVDQLASDQCEQAKKAVGCVKDMKLYCSATCGTC